MRVIDLGYGDEDYSSHDEIEDRRYGGRRFMPRYPEMSHGGHDRPGMGEHHNIERRMRDLEERERRLEDKERRLEERERQHEHEDREYRKVGYAEYPQDAYGDERYEDGSRYDGEGPMMRRGRMRRGRMPY